MKDERQKERKPYHFGSLAANVKKQIYQGFFEINNNIASLLILSSLTSHYSFIVPHIPILVL